MLSGLRGHARSGAPPTPLRQAATPSERRTTVGSRSRSIEVTPSENRTWAVRYEDDPTHISRHETRAEAETAALSQAQQFGYDRVVVHGLDDERDVPIVEPQHAADTPADVKGPAAG